MQLEYKPGLFDLMAHEVYVQCIPMVLANT